MYSFDNEPIHPIHDAYEALKTQEESPGFTATDGYPVQFQATDFPLLAQNGKVQMLGNNQAFFFVKNPKENTDPDQMQLDTTHLKTLMSRVREQGTDFTLTLDADVREDRTRFVEKYQALRPEEEATGRALLAKEAELIEGFLQNGGMLELAKEVVSEGNNLPPQVIEALAQGFLDRQFHVEGVQTDRALEAAVWQVDNSQGGQLQARQNYDIGTTNTDRKWLLGTQPQVEQLRASGHEGATVLSRAVEEMNNLPRINLLPERQQGVTQGRG